MSFRIGRIALAVLAPLAAGCASMPGFTAQHPAWAMNSATCATLGPAVAAMLSSSPLGIFSSSVIGKALCDGESSLAAGPPAQVTQTTTTANTTTRMQ